MLGDRINELCREGLMWVWDRDRLDYKHVKDRAEILADDILYEIRPSRLECRLGLQNGTAGTEDRAETLYENNHKVIWNDFRFGAPVEVRFLWDDPNGDDVFEWVEYGYLTTLPGHTQPDMDGIVHIPELSEEKGSSDLWITVLDLAALPDVQEVIIGVEDE